MKPLDNATTHPLHLLPLRFPPKLVLLPLKALMFKVSFEDGATSPEKASRVAEDVVLKECMGGSLFKVIL
jgi:hypothetical protein